MCIPTLAAHGAEKEAAILRIKEDLVKQVDSSFYPDHTRITGIPARQNSLHHQHHPVQMSAIGKLIEIALRMFRFREIEQLQLRDRSLIR